MTERKENILNGTTYFAGKAGGTVESKGTGEGTKEELEQICDR